MSDQRILLSLFLSGLISVTGAAFAQGDAAGSGDAGNAAGSGARGGARTRVEEPTGSVQGGNTATDVAANQGNQIGHVSGTIVSSSPSGIEIKTDTGNRNFIVDNRTSEAQGLDTGVVVTIYFDKNANGHDRALRVVTGQVGDAPTGALGASDMNRPDPRAQTGAPTDSIAPTTGTQTGSPSANSAGSPTTGSYGTQTGASSGSSYDSSTGSTGSSSGSSYGSSTDTSTSGTTSGTAGGTLPRTAGDMPLVGLIGLGALAGALAARFGRNA
jgi:hypothetical protein